MMFAYDVIDDVIECSFITTVSRCGCVVSELACYAATRVRSPVGTLICSLFHSQSDPSLKPLGPLTHYFIYLYNKKTKDAQFLVTYIRKNLSSFQRSIHVHTPVHQATFEVSKIHTPTYNYIEKAQNVHFLGYLYMKKPFQLSDVHTRLYTYTLFQLASNRHRLSEKWA